MSSTSLITQSASMAASDAQDEELTMISFTRQLRFLLWKGFLVKKRQKFWLAVELVVPCILFIVIALVRTRDFNLSEPQCHFSSKGMISAGLLPFLHSTFCSFSNKCNQQPTTGDEKEFLFNPAFKGSNATKNESIIVETLYYTSLQLRWIGEHPTEFDQIVQAAAEFVHLLANLNISSNGLFQIRDMFDGPQLAEMNKELMEVGLSESTIMKMNKAWVQPSIFSALNVTNQAVQSGGLLAILDKLPLFCNDSLFTSSFSFEPGFEMNAAERTELCNYIDVYASSNLAPSFLHASFINGRPFVLSDPSQRLSVMDLWRKANFLFQQMVEQPLLQFIQKKAAVQFDWQSAMLAVFCGNDPRDLVEDTINPNNKVSVETPLTKLQRRMIKYIETITPGSQSQRNDTCGPVAFHPGLNCSQLEGSMMTKIRPALEGYILVTPKNPATERLVDKLNKPLQMIEYLRNRLYMYPEQATNLQWALHNSDLWNASQNVLAWLEETQPLEKLAGVKFFLTHAFAAPDDEYSLGNMSSQIVDLFNKYTSCFLLDRFRFVANETEMEDTAICLMGEQQYFSGIVFNISTNATNFADFTAYKIRHFADFVDSTSGVADSRNHPFSRHLPLRDLKYLTYGFSFLQESIDRVLIEETSRQKMDIGAYAQQEPYPCITKDTFNVSLFMPLFLILSFIIPSALLVKNIVHEKELRIKEQMRVMGLGDAVHFISWALISLVLNFASVIVISIILKVARIFNNTDYTLLLLVLTLFMFSAIAMSIFFSTFFTNANISTAATCVLWFLLFFPFQLKNEAIKTPTFTKVSLLLPPTAMGYIFQMLASANAMEAASWANVPEMKINAFGISAGGCMTMLAVDTVVFLILAWYISAIAPGTYGVRQPLWFPLTIRYWFPNFHGNKVEYMDVDNFDAIPSSDNFDAEPNGLKLTVHVTAMSKVYGSGTKALNNLNLRLYENQITALLGHNGAGKTTTMSILCGLYSPSSGSAKIYGRDIRNDMRRVREVLGVCPQYNVIFTHLTVAEQLTLFAALKGVADADLDREVAEVLESVSLAEKANKLAGTLSGGMKRRLCIGIALIGGSKFVILDEPTAGVDVTARKEIWRLLQRNKEGRTILLSTHHMDEADVLSDRIAILSEGELVALGSSVFLKRKFGHALTLTICKKRGGAYTSVAQKIVNGSAFQMFIAAENEDEIVFKIPIMTDSTLLEKFFFDLDAKVSAYDLGQYGISAPTLQNIFVSLAPQREYRVPKQYGCQWLRKLKKSICGKCRRTAEDVEQRDLIPVNNVEPPVLNSVVCEPPNSKSQEEDKNNSNSAEAGDSFEEFERPPLLTGWALTMLHLKALLLCRFNYAKRSKRVVLFEVVIPLLLLCACEVYVKVQVPASRPDLMVFQSPLPLETALFGNETDSFINSWVRDSSSTATALLHGMIDPPGLGTRCAAAEPKYVATMIDDYVARMDQKTGFVKKAPSGARGCIPQAGAYDFDRSLSNVSYNEEIECDCVDFGWNCTLENWDFGRTPWFALNTTDRFFDLSGKNLSQFRLVTQFQRDKNETAPFFIGGYSLGHTNLRAATSQQIDDEKFGWRRLQFGWNATKNILGINTTDLDPYDQPVIVDPFAFNITTENVVDAILENADVKENVKVWFNNKVWPSYPIYASGLTNAVLRMYVNETNSSNYGILTVNHPMNETVEESLQTNMDFSRGLALFRITILMLVLGMIPAGFTIYLVEDRICDALHLQIVGGLRKRVYWAVSFMFDMMVFTLSIVLIMLMYAAFGVKEFTYDVETFFSFLLVFWLYGMSAVLYAYSMQRQFSIPALSFVLIAIGTYFIGIVCSLTVILIENLMQQDPTLESAYTTCSILFLVIPQYNLGMSIFRGSMVYQVRLLGINFLDSINRLDVADKLPLPALLDFDVMGLHCVVLIAHVVVAVSLLVFCESETFEITRRRERKATQKLLDVDSKEEDDDVRNEQLRVDGISADDTRHALVVRQLAKAYTKDVLAVRGISFAVEPGECFGLLGLNGAGKTTTFAMLTAKLLPGRGSVDVNGCSVTSGNMEGFQQLGYCPQFDALNMKLSTRENLNFYARIRGIPSSQMEPIVDQLLKALHLRPYADTMTSDLSGGNRRKLSVAVALVSQPSLIFLDEPSAGMDPGSQQFLWHVISRLCAIGKAVVLTSHSMEECEALCTRIAIMDKGKIRCLGGKQHLKNKFGKGYSLTLKLPQASEAKQAAQYIHSQVPGSRIEAIHCSTVFIHIDHEKSSIAEVLKVVNEAKALFTVEDFSLSQSTLDEVFQSLAENEWDLTRGHSMSTVNTTVTSLTNNSATTPASV